jgi:hypothetical protein
MGNNQRVANVGINWVSGLGVIYANPLDSIVSIPDIAFLHALIDEGVDTNEESLISYAEAESINYMDVSGFDARGDCEIRK